MLQRFSRIMGFNDDDDEDENNNVIPLRRSAAPSGPIIELMVPTEFNDAKHIGDKLKNKTIVALNLAKVNPKIAERIIDFAVGVTYALGGGSLKLDSNIFLLTGPGVTLK